MFIVCCLVVVKVFCKVFWMWCVVDVVFVGLEFGLFDFDKLICRLLFWLISFFLVWEVIILVLFSRFIFIFSVFCDVFVICVMFIFFFLCDCCVVVVWFEELLVVLFIDKVFFSLVLLWCFLEVEFVNVLSCCRLVSVVLIFVKFCWLLLLMILLLLLFLDWLIFGRFFVEIVFEILLVIFWMVVCVVGVLFVVVFFVGFVFICIVMYKYFLRNFLLVILSFFVIRFKLFVVLWYINYFGWLNNL